MKLMSAMDGLSAISADLTTEPDWKYDELPPFLLSQLSESNLLEASDSELARVIWFWCRRPKLMFHDSAALVSCFGDRFTVDEEGEGSELTLSSSAKSDSYVLLTRRRFPFPKVSPT